VSKANGWIDYGMLDQALRDDLDPKAPRAMAVLDPVKLVITNYKEVLGDKLDACSAPVHPHKPELGRREFDFGPEIWIERTDYEDVPPKGYNRLFPGNKVRLKYGHVVECTGANKDAQGRVTEVLAKVVPDTKSGTPGADAIKVKGNITWVSVADGVKAEVRLYDRLFSVPQPGTGEKDFLEELNPESLRVVTAYVEPSLAAAHHDDKFQFERHGYFVADRKDHVRDDMAAGLPGKPVFNRVAGMKDSWGK
jgi:glutaminyl-tRNA synthetase